MPAVACEQVAYLHGFSFFISRDDISPVMVKSLSIAEHAIDKLRSKFGKGAVVKGLTLDED
jgi:hypothetical protein